MTRIEHSLLVRRPPETVFRLVSDPLRFPGLFSGLTRIEQISDKARAEGARYLMLMRVGSIDAGSVLVITEWRAPERVAWRSEQGVPHTGSFTLEPAPGGTNFRIELVYGVPGPRFPAALVERLTRHVVDRRLHATLLAVKRVAEFDTGLLEARGAA
jgi:uncharacterized membrane protein